MGQKGTKGKKRKPAARPANERRERQQDARLVATLATAMGGEPLPPGTWVLAVSPVRLAGGEILAWHPPQPVAFNLIEAKRYRDRGARARRGIMSRLKRRNDGNLGPANSRAATDCISDLSAVISPLGVSCPCV